MLYILITRLKVRLFQIAEYMYKLVELIYDKQMSNRKNCTEFSDQEKLILQFVYYLCLINVSIYHFLCFLVSHIVILIAMFCLGSFLKVIFEESTGQEKIRKIVVSVVPCINRRSCRSRPNLSQCQQHILKLKYKGSQPFPSDSNVMRFFSDHKLFVINDVSSSPYFHVIFLTWGHQRQVVFIEKLLLIII